MDCSPPHIAKNAPQSPKTPETHSPISRDSSYVTLPFKNSPEISVADIIVRKKSGLARTWLQDLELYALPESDTEGYTADSDPEAESGPAAPGASADALTSSTDAFVSADASTDVSGDGYWAPPSLPLSVSPERPAAERQRAEKVSDGRTPVRAPLLRRRYDPRFKGQSGKAAGGPLPGAKTGPPRCGQP